MALSNNEVIVTLHKMLFSKQHKLLIYPLQ